MMVFIRDIFVKDNHDNKSYCLIGIKAYRSTIVGGRMLSMKAKYAIRTLIVLAGSEGRTLQSKSIAKQADAPIKFLEAILRELKQYGAVKSKRGIFGGYTLAKPARDIVLGDIIRRTDGMLAPIPAPASLPMSATRTASMRIAAPSATPCWR